MLELVLARTADLQALIALLLSSEARQRALGFPAPSLAYTAEQRRQVERAKIYLAREHGAWVGTVQVQREDAKIWGLQGLDGEAGYIHSLAIAEGRQGQGLGARILALAEERIRALGRPLARLDCRADNAGLCKYYRSQGYEVRGVVALESGEAMQRFEKALGDAR